MTEAIQVVQQENARLRKENHALKTQLHRLQHAIRALNMLDESLKKLTPDTDVFELINTILSSALHAADSEEGSLLLLDEDTNELVFVEVAGPHKEELTGYRMAADAGIVGQVIQSGEPTLVSDVRMDPLWSPQVDEVLGFQTQSLICVPVIHEKRVWGAIELVNKRGGDSFDEEDLEILRLVARLAGLAIARAESFG